ncbi:hypothetical protein ACOMHN_012466 [Nucella lapillus]
MADLQRLLSFFSFILVYYGECSQQLLDQCSGLGFTNSLMCSSCHDLDRFNLAKLKDGCLGCCHEDTASDSETEVLKYAELSVCG